MTSGTSPIVRLYLDACIYLYVFEGNSRDKQYLRRLLLPRSTGGRTFLCTSELSMCECLVGTLKSGGSASGTIYENWSATNAVHEVGPVNWNVLFRAARLRARHNGLKLPDAIHIATAIAFGCSHLLTNDKRLGTRYELAETRSFAGEGPWKGPGAVDIIGPSSSLLTPLLQASLP